MGGGVAADMRIYNLQLCTKKKLLYDLCMQECYGCHHLKALSMSKLSAYFTF